MRKTWPLSAAPPSRIPGPWGLHIVEVPEKGSRCFCSRRSVLSFERNRSSSKNAVNVWFSLKNFASDWGFLSHFLAIFPLGVLLKFQNDWTTATISEICFFSESFRSILEVAPAERRTEAQALVFFGQISVPKMVHASFGSWLFNGHAPLVAHFASGFQTGSMLINYLYLFLNQLAQIFGPKITLPPNLNLQPPKKLSPKNISVW